MRCRAGWQTGAGWRRKPTVDHEFEAGRTKSRTNEQLRREPGSRAASNPLSELVGLRHETGNERDALQVSAVHDGRAESTNELRDGAWRLIQQLDLAPKSDDFGPLRSYVNRSTTP
jgi:hypothetical protein